jgi:signal transduction histidine kinase
MRTPLNAVIGFASLLELQARASGAESGSYAHHIKAAGEHMLAMVTDLLDLNRAAAGTLKLDLQSVSIAASVNESIQMLQPLSQAHGIELDASIDPRVFVVADRVRLQQVLLNLLSNAIKYNRQGGAVQVRVDPAKTGWVRLSVEDQGIGMTPAQLERLFNPFDRLGQERTKIPGAGLGLVIARSIVVQMGGALEVASEPRIGTTVNIELPAAA